MHGTVHPNLCHNKLHINSLNTIKNYRIDNFRVDIISTQFPHSPLTWSPHSARISKDWHLCLSYINNWIRCLFVNRTHTNHYKIPPIESASNRSWRIRPSVVLPTWIEPAIQRYLTCCWEFCSEVFHSNSTANPLIEEQVLQLEEQFLQLESLAHEADIFLSASS